MFLLKDNKGITLMEIIVALGIVILLIVAVTTVFTYSLKANRIIWEQLSTQNEGRKIVQDFINELRSSDYSNIGAYTLDTVDDQEIIFYSNIDNDTYRERVRYFLSGSILKKGVTKPSGVPLAYTTSTETIVDMVNDVSNTSTPIFYYYGQNYGYTSSTPLSQPVSVTDVKMVGIVLELEEDPRVSPAPFRIESKVEIRNLKEN